MKKRDHSYLLLASALLVTIGCVNTPAVQEGDWDGCVIGMYPENGNETLPGGDQQEINDFEKILNHKIGSVVWFPTWDDEFPTKAVQQLHKAVQHLHKAVQHLFCSGLFRFVFV